MSIFFVLFYTKLKSLAKYNKINTFLEFKISYSLSHKIVVGNIKVLEFNMIEIIQPTCKYCIHEIYE